MLELKSMLQKAIGRAGLTRQISASSAVMTARQFLQAALVKEMQGMVRVVSFHQGLLRIACKNSVAAHEVTLLEPGIREAIITMDPRADVKTILVQIRSMEEYEL